MVYPSAYRDQFYDGVEVREPLLTIDHVSLSFGDRVVLRDVCAQVRNIIRPGYAQGQVVGFLGPSGMGKTQLFRVMAGLETSGSGRVLIGKRQTQTKEGLVGVVFQTYTLLPTRTVGENLVTPGRSAGLSKAEATSRAKQLLERFQLADRWDTYPSQLSGGQRQRVAIAQQIICSRDLLLMDEPFSGLDPNMKDEACRLIEQVSQAAEDFTIVVITHDIRSAVAISDQLWVLGRERGPDGNLIPGAHIRHTVNLLERGLAWRPDIAKLPAYAHTVQEIEGLFRTL